MNPGPKVRRAVKGDRKKTAGVPLCCPPPPKNEGRRLKVKDRDRAFAALAKALGHPARVKILRHLASIEGCICGDLVLEVGLAQATVSQHLKVLKSAGLVRGTISGPATCYCIERSTLGLLKGWLGEL